MCRGRSDPEQPGGRIAYVWGVAPQSIGVDGGRITLTGDNMLSVVHAWAGSVECSDLEAVSGAELHATVPPLAGHEGEDLQVTVATEGGSAASMDRVMLHVEG